MSKTQRALLIASPFQGLRGPLNDVKRMEEVLREQYFEISLCCGDDATREGIIGAWHRIVEDISSSDDVVVIYYSGHGGIVEDSARVRKDDDDPETGSRKKHPWRYQFLVPVDFRGDINSDRAGEDYTNLEPLFTGILDVELAQLLRDTTNRTRNVTTIFDCCHSGRMARYPSQNDAVPRNLPEVQFSNISRHIDYLKTAKQWPLDARLDVEGNIYAVRIAAAASTETAWEHGKTGQWVGVFTEALSKALREAWQEGNHCSWRTMLLRVREEVNIDFPLQNPNVEGLDTRLLFSLTEVRRNAIVLHPDGDEGLLQAGRVSGVREGNVYALMPLGAERPSDDTQIGTATVTTVIGLEALAELSLVAGKGPIPQEGVLAFLVHEALYEWPVACPEGLDTLQDAVDGSKYLRRRDSTQDSSSLVEFAHDEQNLVLTNNQGVRLASRQVLETDPVQAPNAINYLLGQAEQLARAQHILTLRCDDPEERFEHRLAVEFGTVRARTRDRIVNQDGSGYIAHGESIYISLENNGAESVFVSVFNINVAGKVSLISRGSSTGIDVRTNRSRIVGADPLNRLLGLPITWPNGIPTAEPVIEHIVLILTNSPVYLKYLESDDMVEFRGDPGHSTLEQLAFRLATGARRDVARESRGERIYYDTLCIPFLLRPFAVRDEYASWNEEQSHELQPEHIPLPEEVVQQEQDLPPRSPCLESEARVSGHSSQIPRTLH